MTEFAILSVQRSGTGFLTSCLNSHPEIHVYPELFLDTDYKSTYNFYRFLIDKIREDEEAITRCARRQLLWIFFDKVLRECAEKSAVGYNVKYDQLAYVEQLAQCLVERRASVVHLVRKNVLKTFISSFLNQRQKQLGRKSHGSEKVTTVKVHVGLGPELLAELERRDQAIEMHRRAFSRGTRYLELEYEDLVHGNEAGSLASEKTQEVLSFLNVNTNGVELSTELRKTNPAGLRDLVMNYDELCVFLGATRWSHLLGEI